MALKHKELIVGIKTAHYTGPEWTPVERAVEAGTEANIPVMVDFGNNHPEAAARRAADEEAAARRHLHACIRACERAGPTGKLNPGMIEGRKRGVIFDVGHGGGSFVWRVAVPLIKEGFVPDSISTDLHISSMNAGMKDMLNVMGKFLAMGVPLTSDRAVDLESGARDQAGELGNLSVGASPTSPCCGSRRAGSGSSTCTARAWRARRG